MITLLKKLFWKPWDILVTRFCWHFHDLIVELYCKAAERLNRDIGTELQAQALQSTANYVRAMMRKSIPFTSEPELREYALKQAPKNGLFMEFGVWTGKSINFFSNKMKESTFHGFDSFEGLPEDWEGFSKKGRFNVGGKLPKVRKNVTLHAGWFDKTLPVFMKEHKDPVSFLHVDCDLYSSTNTIFEYLGERIREGTIIVFDEYFNYPHWEDHEHKAFQEFISKSKWSYDYMGYHQYGREVAVRIKKTN